jgi:hypothetical protein
MGVPHNLSQGLLFTSVTVPVYFHIVFQKGDQNCQPHDGTIKRCLKFMKHKLLCKSIKKHLHQESKAVGHGIACL